MTLRAFPATLACVVLTFGAAGLHCSSHGGGEAHVEADSGGASRDGSDAKPDSGTRRDAGSRLDADSSAEADSSRDANAHDDSGSLFEAGSRGDAAIDAGPTLYADSKIPPAGWQFPYDPNPFTVPACAEDPCATPSTFFDSASDSEVTALLNGGGLDLGDIYQGAPEDNDFPVYYASASDPLYTVTCPGGGGCGTGSVTVHIPDHAYASSGQDHHLTVINLAEDTEYDFWEFHYNPSTQLGSADPVSGGGSVYAGSAGVCKVNAFASDPDACANSAVAAGIPIEPQVLDPREMLAGAIDHTLYVALACNAPGFFWPAKGSDGTCTGGPKDGQRIWLDLTDAQIDALSDPAWAKTLLHAMHHYGWMVSDSTGGSGTMGFANLAAQSFTIWGEPSPWPAFWSATGTTGHVTIPTNGITQANIHILAPCVNTHSC